MARVRDISEESEEQKGTAAFILGIGSFGFLFLGLVALLLSRHYLGNSTGDELIVAGALGIATGIFLGVAVVAVWLDRAWLGEWRD